MMKLLEMEVISKEMVKPTSPTPQHLRRHRLSFLDQISPPIFMPMILFYSSGEVEKKTKDDLSKHLKQSLSQILTQYYMLAGRVSEDNLHVDCNDAGVPFFETRANCTLYDLIHDPDPNEFNKLLAYDLADVKDLGMAVQVNFFSCGGMAVGVGISHKITDAMGFCHLINNWSVVACGEGKMLPPRFVGADIFPPLELGSFLPSVGMLPIEDVVVKRFVFPTDKITQLQDCYTEDTIRPSRIEALSVFIWSRFMATVEGGGDPNKTYLIIHPVNLRRRGSKTGPQLLDDRCFGNIYRIAMTEPTKDDDGKYSDVVRKMRKALKSIDDVYVAKLQEGGDHLDFLQEMMELFLKGEVIAFSFTSLSKFSLYESDFGFGKPVWFGSSRFDFNNLVSFIDTRMEDGVEAWINMSPKDMAKFEADNQLMSYVSPVSPF
ncbi:stemmadenine O-acetyltransferase-like [Impatiens glandulifera]|uniref:stemmadenine O-acetyltransferase-like n=1 Tax=Impatiens glandulifera TaxID=253017 RepID=UPI001FB0D6CE|nr:stemmadenine O-acetyltransferase-like [Impatiens glandulifera]